MHLLLIHQNFPGQFRDLAPAWLAAGHAITAIGSTPAPPESEAWAPIHYWRYTIDPPEDCPEAQEASPLQRGLAVAALCRHLLHSGVHPDVVLAHSGWGEALQLRSVFPHTPLVAYPEIWGTPAALGFGVDPHLDRLLPQLHAANLLAELQRPLERQNLLAALAISQADAAVVPSPSQLDSFPVPLRQRLELIPEGIDPQRLRPDPAAALHLEGLPPLRAGDPIVTLVSRELEPLRGLRCALEAWPLVKERHPRALLLLVGDQSGGYGWEPSHGESHLADALAALPDSPASLGVHHVGVLPHAELMRLLQCSACHLGLSYPHTLSWSLLEALAVGAPVITNHGSPLAAVVHNQQSAMLVPFADPNALAEAILQLLEHPELRQRLGSAGRELVADQFSLQQAMERYDTLFQRLIQPSRAVSS